jgi:hypothetical protein
MDENLPVPSEPSAVASSTPSAAQKQAIVGATLASAAGSAAGISKQRKVLALLIAATSDAISIAATFAPPAQWVVDGATAAALFGALGFRWPILPVLVVEAIPGLAAFPTWLVVVGVIAGTTPTR